MRWLVRGAAALVALLAILLAALAVLLPRLAAREDVQRRLETEAEALLGRDVSWRALSAALLPPSLVVEGAAVAEEGGLAVGADSVRLRLALLPLLTGEVSVAALVVEGAHARSGDLELDGRDGRLVVRARAETLDRIELDVSAAGAALATESVGARLEGRLRAELVRAAEAGEGAPAFVPVRLGIEGGGLRVERSGAALELEDLAGEALAERPGAPLAFELSGRLAEGGGLRARGEATASAEAPFDAAVDLDEVELAAFAPFLAAGRAPEAPAPELRGSASGRIEARGTPAALAALVAKLDVKDAAVSLGEIALRGPLAIEAQLAGPPAALAGPFAIDATGADLVYGSALHKPPGTRAHVSGRLAPQSDGALGLDAVKVELHDADLRVSARLGPRPRARIEAAPFELAGFEALVPAWSGGPLAGRLGIPGLSVALAPLQLDGRLELREVAFTPPGRGPVAVEGALVGRGDAIVADGLRVALAGEPPFEVRGRVGALDTKPRYELEIATPQAPEANVLLASFAGLPDLLYGPLRFDGGLSGDLGGETPALDAARGSFALLVGGKEAGGGRLVGVSLLRGTVDQLGALGAAALAAGRTFGGRDLQRFYGDEFEVIRGTFELAQGSVRTPDLQMVYRDYTVDLRGTVDLHDLALDLTGELSIDGKVDSALAESEAGERRVIPLAHVRGTVSEPRVELTAEAVARLVASWATPEQREGLEKKIDEALGSEGAGRQVFDALEGILERRK